MQDVLVLFNRLASILCFVLIGYFVVKRNILSDKGKDVVSLLLNRIALPGLIISAYVKIKLSPDTIRNIIIIVIGALVVYLLNYLYAKYKVVKLQLPHKSSSVYLNGALHANTAFLAFALLEAVYGSDGLFYGTIYYMVDNILFTTIGMRRFAMSKKIKLPPVTISLIVALVLMIIFNMVNIDVTASFPYVVARDLGTMTTPLSFLFMGMLIYEYDLMDVISNRIAQKLILVKMLIIPIIVCLGCWLLNLQLDRTLIIVILIQASMPPLSVLISMAYEYHQDTKFAASLVIMGHIFAIFSIPILFILFNYLF
ncbi:MAG: AEC family transporter [Bacilli bacterium]|jgi:predicted permease|nr:AEC family transporter [Bacilli bacterium]